MSLLSCIELSGSQVPFVTLDDLLDLGLELSGSLIPLLSVQYNALPTVLVLHIFDNVLLIADCPKVLPSLFTRIVSSFNALLNFLIASLDSSRL